MADAAYAILSQPKDYTGQFLVDDDVLKKEGIQDFAPYAVEPGRAAGTLGPALCGPHGPVSLLARPPAAARLLPGRVS